MEVGIRGDEVFRRTLRGQQAVLAGLPNLGDLERRLLLIVNGETPLRALSQLAPMVTQSSHVERLLNAGLIEAERG